MQHQADEGNEMHPDQGWSTVARSPTPGGGSLGIAPLGPQADDPAQTMEDLAQGVLSLGCLRAHQGQVRRDKRPLSSLGYALRLAGGIVMPQAYQDSLKVHGRFSGHSVWPINSKAALPRSLLGSTMYLTDGDGDSCEARDSPRERAVGARPVVTGVAITLRSRRPNARLLASQ